MSPARKRTWTNPGDGGKSVNPHDVQTPVSWWTNYAGADQREHFIEAAKVRDAERTHAENLREGKKNHAMRQWPARYSLPKLTPSKAP